MADKESLVNRVAALLAKAESTEKQFPEEAESLRAKAEELMVRHAIDQAMLQSHLDAKRDDIIKKVFTFGGQWASAQAHLAYCVAQGFDLRTVETRFGGDPAGMVHPVWIGYKSDVEAAELLLPSLLIQVANGLNRYTEELRRDYGFTTTKQMYRHRRSFMFGFGDRVCTRLKEMRRKIVEEVDTETSGGGSLVLVARADLVKAKVDEFFPKLGKARKSAAGHSEHGLRAGIQAGSQADLNQDRIGSRKGLNT